MLPGQVAEIVAASGGQLSTPGNGLATCQVAGEVAVRLWRQLFAAHPSTGLYPIVVGNVTNLRLFDKALPARLAADAVEIDVPGWVTERLDEMREELGEDDPELEIPPHGSWPEASTRSRDFYSVMNSNGTRYLGVVGLPLLPLQHPWGLPFGL